MQTQGTQGAQMKLTGNILLTIQSTENVITSTSFEIDEVDIEYEYRELKTPDGTVYQKIPKTLKITAKKELSIL
jgi:hypothetical protein